MKNPFRREKRAGAGVYSLYSRYRGSGSALSSILNGIFLVLAGVALFYYGVYAFPIYFMKDTAYSLAFMLIPALLISFGIKISNKEEFEWKDKQEKAI